MALPLCGCTGMQSALDPSGQHAGEVLWLWWLMLGVLAAAFALVTGVLLVALFGRSRLREMASANRMIVAGGLLLPGVPILVSARDLVPDEALRRARRHAVQRSVPRRGPVRRPPHAAHAVMLPGWRALLVPGLLALAACDETAPPPHLQVAGGDPERGRAAIARHGCGSCHVIPGVPGAQGLVGPPLTDFARRGYVAGVVPNWPGYLVRWIMGPPAIAPQTAMPDVGVDEQDARDIAAYLYTLGAERAAVHPPEPLPPLAPPEELRALRAEEDRLLGGYGRVGEGEARIPIERAMELLLEREAREAVAPAAAAQ